jgi:hypothetical protein
MKLRLILPGILAVLIIIVSACGPPPNLRDENLLRDDSLITNEPCAAPCWRGITPGETTWRTALTLIEDDLTLENMQIQEDENSDAALVEFQPVGGTPCCQVLTEDGQLVSYIFLRTAPTTTLAELIAAQGEPTYVVGSPFSDDQAIFNLIYPNVPMVIYAFVPGTGGSVTGSSEIIGVLYMKPSDMELLLQTSSLRAWQGFQSFQAYEQQEFVVTPSVTLTPAP